MTIQIRRFQPLDAAAVAQLLHRNFLEVNSLDYPFAQMEKLVAEYTPDKLCEQARYAHTYVAESRDQIIGTGTICPYWGSVTESIILSVFVHPDKHRKGIGSLLINKRWSKVKLFGNFIKSANAKTAFTSFTPIARA
jgi:GNAT superfamily N-acetyltransferase